MRESSPQKACVDVQCLLGFAPYILYKDSTSRVGFPAPLALTLAFLLLAISPVRAGHWNLHAACDQQPTADPNFTPPSDSSYGFESNPCRASSSRGGGQTASASMTVTFTLTATWMPDGAPASDPAPPKLMLEETAITSWSGSSSAGQTPTGSSSSAGQTPTGSSSNPVGGAETPLPPGGSFGTNAGGRRQGHAFTPMSVSGGTATLTRVFTGAASSASSPQNECSATAGLDGYSARIHAQPYNWHKTSGTDNGDGSLTFTYDWNSTSGDKTNLSSCFIHRARHLPRWQSLRPTSPIHPNRPVQSYSLAR